jgi:NADPH:quinone reductase-like Zn-dependent oxidoreductase
MKALFRHLVASDVLEYIDIPAPAKKKEILIEMRGLNFADVYRRKGYHLRRPSLLRVTRVRA